MNSVQEMPVQAGEMSSFAKSVYYDKYAWKDLDGNPTEEWEDTAERVVSKVLGTLGYHPGKEEYKDLLNLVKERKFMPGGRYLYASGRQLHQTQNCLLLKAQDSREGWAGLSYRAQMALMTGAGIGVDYSDIRHSGAFINKTGGISSGPLSLMRIINEIGRNVMQGGSRRSAIWAGLNWKHPDIFKFIKAKEWPEIVIKARQEDMLFPAELDMTNISVLLDDEFFLAYEDENHEFYDHAHSVYHKATVSMIQTAEPGFSVDLGQNAKETLRNACTEVCSEDDSDICNLGSINLARIEDINEFKKAIRLGTLFLIAGTVYSHVPYEKVEKVRRDNRRLGLGLMGVHEWLLKRGKKYGPDEELGNWMEEYAKSTQIAHEFADKHVLSHPIKTRAIAPTGTIGIIAETTTGIEPIFCAAYARRVREANPDGDTIRTQYVVDPTAKRMINLGIPAENIEDSYTLSLQVERRIAMQAWMQQYVDHGISSTINLPAPITDEQEIDSFKEILYRYLPNIRGITCYPDGAIAGQPLTPVDLEYAIAQEGTIIEEAEEKCKNGVCGV